MRRLGHQDWARLSRSIRELYAQETVTDLRRVLLRELLVHLPSDYASYNEFDFREGRVVVELAADAPEITRLLPVFEAHIGQDPHVQHLARTGDCRAHQVIDLISQREFREHPIYRDFYRHIGVEHRGAFFFQRRGEVDIAVALLRRLAPFASRELDLMEALRPHLEQAYFNARHLERVKTEWTHQCSLLAEAPGALLLADADGRIVMATGRALEWLGHCFPEDVRAGGRLPETLRRWVARERNRLSTHAYSAPSVPLEVVRPDARLSVRMTLRPGGETLLILSVESFGAAAQRLEELGFTAREAEVLYWLAEGKTNAEIGQVLGISRRTVDKHVERILAKLGVETRTAAARVAREELSSHRYSQSHSLKRSETGKLKSGSTG
jgi:DNA-binding CsgD family transcriptional regulator